MEALQTQTQINDIQEWHDLWFNNHKKTGYVAVTNFDWTMFYGANDIKKVIQSTKGYKKRFISINAFDVDWHHGEFSRKAENLKQIRNIAIDIDQYELGLTIEEALDNIQSLVLKNIIPEPNLILTSRGIQLFYSIDRGASPKMSWLTKYITSQFINKLKHIGADGNAKDVSRVMRVPNSVNERNNSIVKPRIQHYEAYSLDILRAYCKPLDKPNNRKLKKHNVVRFIDDKLVQYYVTNNARTEDFDKLIELRDGDFTYMRSIFLYIYSYHEALLHDTQKDLVDFMLYKFKDVYSTDDKPLSETEMTRTIKNAKKDADEFFNHYQRNGYQIIFKERDGIKKPHRTDTLIKALNIKEEEQMYMKSVRNGEIARKQHAEYMRKKRLEDGTHKQTWQEYNASRKDSKLKRIEKLADLLEQYPNATQRELADLMGVSLRSVKSYMKVINR